MRTKARGCICDCFPDREGIEWDICLCDCCCRKHRTNLVPTNEEIEKKKFFIRLFKKKKEKKKLEEDIDKMIFGYEEKK